MQTQLYPRHRNQKLWGWVPGVCVLARPQGNSEACLCLNLEKSAWRLWKEDGEHFLRVADKE
jgi:hypothetical protein